MKIEHKVKLTGINVLGERVKFLKDVVEFTDDNSYFSITMGDANSVKLITPKGTYYLKKHTSLNIYSGICGDTKVRVSLKKIVGLLSYWAEPKAEK
ncbi:MAG: hypothetical protein DRH26_01980 [Deltaproteobacteria bacterium]|nr:MAG: hypothetical protein DRH26_01980 [Deltaproteobacteria bacterium]